MRKEVRGQYTVSWAMPVFTLISWNCTVRWLHNIKWEAACFFKKTLVLDQIWCNEERKWITELFCQVWGCNYQAFTGNKYWFCHQAPISRFTKTCLPEVSKLCKYTPKTHCTSMRKEVKRECFVSVDCHICCYSDKVKLYCQMTSQKEVASSLFFFKKAQILDQRWCYEEKNEPRCFSQYWGYNFPALTGGKYCFCQWAPMSRFRKTWFSAVSELCKNTTRTHCTIPWEKRSRENVLWMLNPITVVTPNK